MTTKQELEKYVSSLKDLTVPRMTYKLFNQSFKIFYTHDYIQQIREYLETIADKNNKELKGQLKSLINQSKDLDYFSDNRLEVTQNWDNIAYHQYFIFTTTVNALDVVLQTVDDDLVIKRHPFAESVLMTKRPTTKQVNIKHKK